MVIARSTQEPIVVNLPALRRQDGFAIAQRSGEALLPASVAGHASRPPMIYLPEHQAFAVDSPLLSFRPLIGAQRKRSDVKASPIICAAGIFHGHVRNVSEESPQTVRKGMVSVKRGDRRTSSVLTASAVVATAATSLTLLSASAAYASPGSWEVIACKSAPEGSLHGTLRIHNQDTATAHSYTARFGWGKGTELLGSTEVRTGMIEPGQSQDVDASTSIASATIGEIPAESISCTVYSVRDENGNSVGS